MATSKDFIKKYGDKTFSELPFTDVDNLLLCEIFYMPFEKVLYKGFNDKPVLFSDACKKVFAYNGYKHISPGFLMNNYISQKMMALAETVRYKDVKVYACESVFGTEPAVQFAAMTFILPDDTKVVIYRGTDDTWVGWKEDLDIYTKKGIPSHKLCVDYLERVAKDFPDGDIIICGHSKGGNVALHSALYCDESVRNRIERVYNNDGPGFYSYNYIESKPYNEIINKYRHFVPDCSFVGMLLVHDDDYIPVKSTRLLGMLQHDLATWKIKGTQLLTRDDLTFVARVTDLVLKKMLYNMDEEKTNNFEAVLSAVIAGMGQVNITNFSKNLISSLKGAIDTWSSIDEPAKELFRTTFVGIFTVIEECTKLVIMQDKEARQKSRVSNKKYQLKN